MVTLDNADDDNIDADGYDTIDGNGMLEAEVEEEAQPAGFATTWFISPRHIESIVGIVNTCSSQYKQKDQQRMKTVSVALVMCLNIGVDPPDVVKPSPCARMECWIDPTAENQNQKSLLAIGTQLVKQYTRWQPRARYKQSLDPTIDDVKKLCMSLRRNAKEERVLFHYNGHGVPKPTGNGEVWVFNKTFTQYIPLSIYDLQTWMASPSIYVYDCNGAGLIIRKFEEFARQQRDAAETMAEGTPHSSTTDKSEQSATGDRFEHFSSEKSKYSSLLDDCLHLAACKEDEILPTNPELPADLFSSCLTTPIRMSGLFYMLRNKHKHGDDLTMEMIAQLPGDVQDRRTMLGELNWIFTSITDSIAWNTLQDNRDLFNRLFRQDLLVASLFRNFILAVRIMSAYNCTPVSSPSLPPTQDHPLWNAWDYAFDIAMNQLIESKNGKIVLPYQPSPFFSSQITAFQVWLDYGYEQRSPPEQLPIVLQVLLSQLHRVPALEVLGRFLDLGDWAVSLAMSVGIYPYVLRLLQSHSVELKSILTFIWAKIIAVVPSVSSDLVFHNLVRDGTHGYKYFHSILMNKELSIARDRTLSAFILATVLDNNPDGQKAIYQGGFLNNAAELLDSQTDDLCPIAIRWILIAVGRLWFTYHQARLLAAVNQLPGTIHKFLGHECPEVRAAAAYALGTLLSNKSHNKGTTLTNMETSSVGNLVKQLQVEGSPMVRKEIIVALHWHALDFESSMVATIAQIYMDNQKAMQREQLMQQSPFADGRKYSEGPSSPAFGFEAHVKRQYSVTANAYEDMLRHSISVSSASDMDRYPPPPSSPVHRSTIPRISIGGLFGSQSSITGNIPPSPSGSDILSPKLSSPRLRGVQSSVTSPRLSRSTSENSFVVRSDEPFTVQTVSMLGKGLYVALKNHLVERDLHSFLCDVEGLGTNTQEKVWNSFLALLADPSDDVANTAKLVMAYFARLVLEQIERQTKFQEETSRQLDEADNRSQERTAKSASESETANVQFPKPIRGLSTDRREAIEQKKHSNNLSSRGMHEARLRMQTNSSIPETGVADKQLSAFSGSHGATQATAANGYTHRNATKFHVGTPDEDGGGTPPPQGVLPTGIDVSALRKAATAAAPTPSSASASAMGYNQSDASTSSAGQSSGNGIQTSDNTDENANNIRTKALISTQFIPWSAKMFADPVMHRLNACHNHQSEIFENGIHSRKSHHKNKNNKWPVSDWSIDAERELEKKSKMFEDQALHRTDYLENEVYSYSKLMRAPTAIVWYPLLPIVVAAVGDGQLSVLNWQLPEVHPPMQNQQPILSDWRLDTISCLHVVNPLTHGYLMTTTNSGDIRIWEPPFDFSDVRRVRTRDDPAPKLISAFSMFANRKHDEVMPHTVVSWEQRSGTIIGTGDTKVLRFWSAERERIDLDIKLEEVYNRHSYGTCIASDNYDLYLTGVGFSDNKVCVYDRRVAHGPPIIRYARFSSPIVNCFLRKRDFFYAISRNGECYHLDRRFMANPVQVEPLFAKNEQKRVTAFDVHLDGNLMAVGIAGTGSTMTGHKTSFSHQGGGGGGLHFSSSQTYQGSMLFLDNEFRKLREVNYHTHNAQKLSQVSVLRFHPLRCTIAVGGADKSISIFGNK